MKLPLFLVDAFAERPFTGNPAAVCLLDRPRSEGWMQTVAAEMNRPETAFLLPEGEGFSLRWFTPVQEVDLCGHATLASAHVLWEIECLQPDEPAVFFTKSGRLTAWRSENGTIWMDFPAEPSVPCEPPTELLRVLGSAPIRYVGRNRMDYLVLLDREATVRTFRPDLARLQELDIRGLIVTAPAEDVPADFVSRFFAPRVGVPEDPVTGSAHCCLGPFWAERLGRTRLSGYQVSARGGRVEVEVHGERVHLGGRAVTVLQGKLLSE
ncbi:phenazine biosynthesis protein PhzF family [Rhodothermus marinus SG0.5JP17-172]|uniref:PhzF family phenazine biosynthesis protein n=1 Tax=Rhodothermus marinus TaxID=29549 RepID=UPI000223DAA5|nr:PhzF family phenazine biosynthesis protein [Rhodothermus marinus]AEN74150.1 phenazine biosynthesis protein PhzF family [Rhodothermus marinus SG0.5JP17-172]